MSVVQVCATGPEPCATETCKYYLPLKSVSNKSVLKNYPRARRVALIPLLHTVRHTYGSIHQVRQVRQLFQCYASGVKVAKEWEGRAGGGGLREAVARWFFQQLVLTLDYCHAKEVVHRDIKLENVLLDLVPGAPLPLVRLADFGLSRRHNAATPCETYVGTPAYLAPELLQLWMEHGSLALAEQGAVHYDGTKVDVWALGVLLYTLLFKGYPFGCLSSGDLEQAALGAPGAGDQGSSTQQASVRRLLAAQVEYPSPPIAGGHPVLGARAPANAVGLDVGHTIRRAWSHRLEEAAELW
ncbi:protein kinase domain-containing protein [Haematococcus lacustris]|uniref:Protein kinase domain-containing protein n=1 Tax=Haematococcus lacustris TaxID=44745 RepID=A0A6A0A6U1_HAELA|nr:protein kinase domain-containing protein [Haematococcus lacustris]